MSLATISFLLTPKFKSNYSSTKHQLPYWFNNYSFSNNWKTKISQQPTSREPLLPAVITRNVSLFSSLTPLTNQSTVAGGSARKWHSSTWRCPAHVYEASDASPGRNCGRTAHIQTLRYTYRHSINDPLELICRKLKIITFHAQMINLPQLTINSMHNVECHLVQWCTPQIHSEI